ncbi:MAG: N-acetylmuramoyl-L-alanine amidase family protein, partial [Bacillota bacterium]
MSDLSHLVEESKDPRGKQLAGRRLALDVPVQHGGSLPWEEGIRSVARYTAAMLESLGASVLLTEGSSASESVEERARAIEAHRAEILICLRAGRHASTHIRGLRALTPGLYLWRNRKLAESLLGRVSDRTGLPSRGIPLWPWFPPDADALMRRARPTCVVFECGCLTCPADELLMSRRAFQMRCAYGLVEGILRFLGVVETDSLSLYPVEEGLESEPVAAEPEPEPEPEPVAAEPEPEPEPEPVAAEPEPEPEPEP